MGIMSILMVIGGIVLIISTQANKYNTRRRGDRPWYDEDLPPRKWW